MWNDLTAYLKQKRKSFLFFLVFGAVYTIVLYLYQAPLEAALYGLLLTGMIGGIDLTAGFFRFRKKRAFFEKIRENGTKNLEPSMLPEAMDSLEADYQSLIVQLIRDSWNHLSEEKKKEEEMEEYYTLWAHQIKTPIAAMSLLLQEAIVQLIRDSWNHLSEEKKKEEEMEEYYTLWAHQIKTPIAAMSLLLQEADTPEHAELSMELFSIEQYVEMVLQYLRIGSESTDFVLKEYDLDECIRQAIRKYARSFIRKKISLDFTETGERVLTGSESTDFVLKEYDLDECIRQAIRKYARSFIRKKISLDFTETGERVLTDEKWLVFVLEQLLSNALKYTKAGTIRIYADDQDLIIEDTGIGIASDDLPRIFEKGYTGYNGRKDKKSTGIGLYLCRRILNRLSHGIAVTSEPGKGTKVRLYLQREKMEFD